MPISSKLDGGGHPAFPMKILTLKIIKQDKYTETNPVFNYNSGIQEVVGYVDDKNYKKGYIYKCHNCAKDPSLFPIPLFRISKAALLKGFLACGCSARPRYNGFQILELARRIAEIKGYTIKGFSEQFNGYRTKLILECPTHGEWKNCSMDNFKRGRCCPGCSDLQPTKAYIAEIWKGHTLEGYKFGVSNSPEKRLYMLNWKSPDFSLFHHSIYTFSSWEACVEAERMCSSVLNTGIVPLNDGINETFDCKDLDKVIDIYKQFGGIKTY